MQAAYTEAVTFGFGDIFASGFLIVANNPVIMQMGIGPRGQHRWGSELFIPPSTFPLQAGDRQRISGVRFKQVPGVGGTAPQVFGSLFYPGEPAVYAGNPFTDIITPSGVVAAVDFQKLAEVTLSAATAPITISNIPQTYANLLVVMKARTTHAVNNDALDARFNNDAGANYYWINQIDSGGAVVTGNAPAFTYMEWAYVPGFNSTPNWGTVEVLIPNYTVNGQEKTFKASSGNWGSTPIMHFAAGKWTGTAPITTITLASLGPVYDVGTTVKLYGLS